MNSLNINLPAETLVAGFSISGNVRCLSHKETFKLFCRAMIRSGIKLKFSQGFNPRPKMSLPLPRAVGICSKDERLTAQIINENGLDSSELYKKLSGELPSGCELSSLEILPGKVSYYAAEVLYSIKMKSSADIAPISEAVKEIEAVKTAGDEIVVERHSAKGLGRKMNILPFIGQIEIRDNEILFSTFVSNEGSIRVDEVLNLLKINQSMLACPVERVKVEWKKK